MSYDISLKCSKCAECDDCYHYHYDVNYTSNVVPMWRKAMPETDGLAGLDDSVAMDVEVYLRLGIERMEKDPATYREMNPENGWGDFDTQLQMLMDFRSACLKHPSDIVKVSR